MNVVLEWANSVLGSSQQSYLQGTGAIDVIAIRHADGTISCSPFHVKIGKSAVKRDSKKIVRLKVNGKEVDLSMKIGPAGEAFFVTKTREIIRGEKDEYNSPSNSTIPNIHSPNNLNPTDSNDMSRNHSPAPSSTFHMKNNHFMFPNINSNDLNENNRTVSQMPVMITMIDEESGLRARSLSANDIGPIEKQSEDSNQLKPKQGSADAVAYGNGSEKRSRAMSDLSNTSSTKLNINLHSKSNDELDKNIDHNNSIQAATIGSDTIILSNNSLQQLESNTIDQSNNNINNDNFATNNESEQTNDSSWVWKWGYLPVKAKAKSSTDLKSLNNNSYSHIKSSHDSSNVHSNIPVIAEKKQSLLSEELTEDRQGPPPRSSNLNEMVELNPHDNNKVIQQDLLQDPPISRRYKSLPSDMQLFTDNHSRLSSSQEVNDLKHDNNKSIINNYDILFMENNDYDISNHNNSSLSHQMYSIPEEGNSNFDKIDDNNMEIGIDSTLDLLTADEKTSKIMKYDDKVIDMSRTTDDYSHKLEPTLSNRWIEDREYQPDVNNDDNTNCDNNYLESMEKLITKDNFSFLPFTTNQIQQIIHILNSNGNNNNRYNDTNNDNNYDINNNNNKNNEKELLYNMLTSYLLLHHSKMISLCSNILNGDQSAPEPTPITVMEVESVLHSYQITINDIFASAAENSFSIEHLKVNSSLESFDKHHDGNHDNNDHNSTITKNYLLHNRFTVLDNSHCVCVLRNNSLFTAPVARRLLFNKLNEHFYHWNKTARDDAIVSEHHFLLDSFLIFSNDELQKAFSEPVTTRDYDIDHQDFNEQKVPFWVGMDIKNWKIPSYDPNTKNKLNLNRNNNTNDMIAMKNDENSDNNNPSTGFVMTESFLDLISNINSKPQTFLRPIPSAFLQGKESDSLNHHELNLIKWKHDHNGHDEHDHWANENDVEVERLSTPVNDGDRDSFPYEHNPQNDNSRNNIGLDLDSSGSMDNDHHARRFIKQDAIAVENEGLFAVKSTPLDSKDPKTAELEDSSILPGNVYDNQEDVTDNDGDNVSLEDISLEDISPEPAGGDFYDSDTDSYLSLEDGSGDGRVNSSSDKGISNGSWHKRKFRKYRYRKALVPSQEQLLLLELRNGENEITFELEGCAPLRAQLFVWPEDSKILVSDIEGVITNTKANKGAWVSFLGGGSKGVTVHDDSIELFHSIHQNGYHILYITHDANSSASGSGLVSSKDYLKSITSITGLPLPAGPIFKSPESLIRAFGASRTDVFKAAALRGVKSLFPVNHNPYHACFGFRMCDVEAYSRFGFPEGRIFLVNEKGEIRSIRRIQLSLFKDLGNLVHEMFPYVKSGCSGSGSIIVQNNNNIIIASVSEGTTSAVEVKASRIVAEDNYNDYNYWKIQIPIIDDIP
eukprot:gene10042-13500_t